MNAGTVPYAVTRATGQIGSRVARRLAAAGAEQRLIVRDPSRDPTLPATAQYRDGDAMRAALTGVDTLFLVFAAEPRGRPELSEHLR